MRAATELLDAERGTLFIHDAATHTLWSRYAEGMEQKELRMPDHLGIAGHVLH